MDDLIRYYDTFRIKSDKHILDVTYLEGLFTKDLKKLQFIIYYWYLTDSEIPIEVQYSSIISFLVYTLLQSIHDQKVHDYYNKYFCPQEVQVQWSKIHKEQKMFEKRALYKKKFIDKDGSENK